MSSRRCILTPVGASWIETLHQERPSRGAEAWVRPAFPCASGAVRIELALPNYRVKPPLIGDVIFFLARSSHLDRTCVLHTHYHNVWEILTLQSAIDQSFGLPSTNCVRQNISMEPKCLIEPFKRSASVFDGEVVHTIIETHRSNGCSKPKRLIRNNLSFQAVLIYTLFIGPQREWVYGRSVFHSLVHSPHRDFPTFMTFGDLTDKRHQHPSLYHV